MHILSTLLAFALTLGILITFHELGHYWVAKWMGVKILRFSLGFGPVLWSRRWGPDQTEWSLSLLPLGGYVKMLDETEAPVSVQEHSRAYNRQPVLHRMAIVAAGPIANLLLAVLLYWGMFVSGVPALRPILAEPLAGTVAALAGLHAQDQIKRIAGDSVRSWDDVNWVLLQHAGTPQPVPMQLTTGKVAYLPLHAVRLDDAQHTIADQLGLQMFEPMIPAVLGTILPDSVAAHVGLRVGDQIVSVGNQVVRSWQEVVPMIRQHPNTLLQLHILRNQHVLQINLMTAMVVQDGQQEGRIGAGPRIDPNLMDGLLTTVRDSPVSGLQHALKKCWQTIVLNLQVMGKMLMGQMSWHALSGPISIADYAGQSARFGLMPFLSFLAVVSIGLGVLNLLPVPLLDGGHLMYYVVELFTGTAVSARVLEAGQRIGLILLLSVMFLAFYNDIARLSGS